MKKLIPYLLILLGFCLLFFMGMVLVAGICFLIGIVMIIESVWPEQWEAEKREKRNDCQEATDK